MDREAEFQGMVAHGPDSDFFKGFEFDVKNLDQNKLTAEQKLEIMKQTFRSTDDEDAHIEMIRKYSLMAEKEDISGSKKEAIEKFLPWAKQQLPGWQDFSEEV